MLRVWQPLMIFLRMRWKNRSERSDNPMTKWFIEMWSSMVSMTFQPLRISIWWTVDSITQESTSFKGIFTYNCCSCTLSVLISVKYPILTISCALLDILKNTLLWWEIANSQCPKLRWTMEQFDLINISWSSWFQPVNPTQKQLNPKKDRYPKLPKEWCCTETSSKITRSKFSKFWEVKSKMERLTLTGVTKWR